MSQYLLSVHSGTDGDAASAAPDQFQQMMALEESMKSSGAWLFSGRLTDPDMATVVKVTAGEALTTDGPFVESKKHLAGFYIIEAPDLDVALGWATKTSAIIGVPIEIRPFFGFQGA